MMSRNIGIVIGGVNLYCKRIIFGVYDIWRTLNFRIFSVDFIWRLILNHLIIPLAMYLILQRGTTAKSAKKNTSPNVIHLQ